MHIDGEIKNIIFRNEESGYTVLDLKTSGGEIVTAVGIFPPICVGSMINAEGDFKKRNQYGLQFEITKFTLSDPIQLDGIKNYLSSGLIRGLGKVTAKNIIDMFGLNSLNVMTKPNMLSKVRGISLKKASEFAIAFEKAKSAQEAVIFLQSVGVSINLSLKIFRAYGNKTISLIKNNPYILVEDIDGIGFLTADKIASLLGIEKNSERRIVAGLVHNLKETSLRYGNTYLPREELIKQTVSLLHIGNEDDGLRISESLEDLVLLGQLKSVEICGTRAIMLSKNFNTEKSIAQKLTRFLDAKLENQTDGIFEIEEFEKENLIELHPSQKDAVAAALNNGVVIITGGPGTGKTTIIKCILNVFKNLKIRTVLCAPTGRAAKRMTEATGEEAKTIHRLLEIEPNGEGGTFSFDEYKKLNVDAIIVDEVSMVDEYIFLSLLKSLSPGTRIILVGDRDQLPSVGAGNVLSDIISSGVFCVKELTHIYRQATESGIVMSAHSINSGKMPCLDNTYKDFFFIEALSPKQISDIIVGLCINRLPKYLNISPLDVQVLCPMKKGESGINNLNAVLQSKLNPKKQGEKELYFGDTVFRVGDKVMHMQNNYQLAWTSECDGHQIKGMGVFNGDIGYITMIDSESFLVKFDDGRVANYASSDLDQLSLAYATTIHKAQGSEFDAAVISLDANFLLRSRNLIYTAVTRAKKMAVLVGSKENLYSMIKRNQTVRHTLLTKFILDEIK